MQPPFHRPRSERGFTLVEAIVVVSIVGILLGFGYSGFTGVLNRYRCQGAMNRVVQALKLAQMKAIEQNMRYYIRFGGSGNDTLTIRRTTGCSDATEQVPAFVEINLTSEYPGVDVVGLSSCNGIYFDCRGMPKTAGGGAGICTVRLTPKGKPAEQGNVTISWLGRIQVATPDTWKY